MKQGIHPNYVDCTITCACGNVIHTRDTKPEIRVEVCSKCHPSTPASRSWLTPADVLSALSAATPTRLASNCIKVCIPQMATSAVFFSNTSSCISKENPYAGLSNDPRYFHL